MGNKDNIKQNIAISELRREVQDLRERLEKCQERNRDLEVQTDAMRSVLRIYQSWGRRPV
jgi:regulator of replication initiation timing|tara:strand:- start:1123 stop:1302 length:180 start_codon:yes stop_codon:yes gene_type:complete